MKLHEEVLKAKHSFIGAVQNNCSKNFRKVIFSVSGNGHLKYCYNKVTDQTPVNSYIVYCFSISDFFRAATLHSKCKRLVLIV